MIGWKVFTHDWRSPVQGGSPVVTGPLPFTLPTRRVDRGDAECGAGWNFTRLPEDALSVAGLWPDGHPSRLTMFDPGSRRVTEVGSKCRVSGGMVVREATPDEIRAAVTALSVPFGEHQMVMVDAQLAWHGALSRPLRRPRAVAAGLRAALEVRGLDWQMKQYPTARAAWEAHQAAREAREARESWESWESWADQAAWAARAARAARAAWAAWADQAARAARAARAALIVRYTALAGWTVNRDPDLLTVGLIDAYRNGLGVAVPIGQNTLGWAMEEAT